MLKEDIEILFQILTIGGGNIAEGFKNASQVTYICRTILQE